MKNLWKILPPFLSDTFGLLETVNNTDGLMLIDDSAGYRNVPVTGKFESRSICSNIRMEDVINGTKKKILDIWNKQGNSFDPSFVLLCAAPASSMIGTDLDDAAEEISRIGNIPAASVNISGHKTYDYGISKGLEAIAKLLLSQRETQNGAFNILGENGIDRSDDAINALTSWIGGEASARSMSPLTKWCVRTDAAQLQSASAAEANLVTTISGLAAAKYMQKAFRIPYVAAAPLGKTWSRMVMDSLKNKETPATAADQEPKRILIIEEQLRANAIRATLRLDYGMSGIQVASFFMMDKTLMESGDKRLKYEEDLQKLLSEGSYDLIIGDELFKVFAPENAAFLSLPCRAFIVPPTQDAPLLHGEELNRWLDCVLPDAR